MPIPSRYRRATPIQLMCRAYRDSRYAGVRGVRPRSRTQLRGHSGTLAQARGFYLARPSLSGCNLPHGFARLRSNTRVCEQAEEAQVAPHGVREIVARAEEQLRPILRDRSVLRSCAHTQPLVVPVGLGSVPGALRAGLTLRARPHGRRYHNVQPLHRSRARGRMVAAEDDYMASHPRARPAIGSRARVHTRVRATEPRGLAGRLAHRGPGKP
jgi:hypothetical protein